MKEMRVQSLGQDNPLEEETATHSSILPGKSHGQRSLVDYSPWGCQELDTTEQLHFPFHFHALEKEMATHPNVLAWRIPGTGEIGRAHV